MYQNHPKPSKKCTFLGPTLESGQQRLRDFVNRFLLLPLWQGRKHIGALEHCLAAEVCVDLTSVGKTINNIN